MSTDFSIKPVGAPVATPIAQPVSEAANNAVATVLPASQSVTVVDPAPASATIRQQAITFRIRRFSIAPRPRSSIRSINERTDAVVSSFRTSAMLRRRAYFHTLDLTKGIAATRRRHRPQRPDVSAHIGLVRRAD